MTQQDGAFAPPGIGRPIPRPQVPLRPVLSASAFRSGKAPASPSVLDAGDALETVSGRYAIALALKQMGAGPGDEVLVPAYHCPAMIHPILWIGGKPLFYRLGSDLSVNLDDVRAKLSDRTKSLMAVNYFGFPQDLSLLRRFCDQHAICFLEDCAHSFFGQHEGRPLGSFGHYAIASTAKFFPVNEGGCLVSGQTRLRDIRLQPRGHWVSAKSAFNAVEEAVRYDRLPLLRPFVGVANRLLRVVPRPSSRQDASSESDRRLPVAGGPESGIEGFDKNLVNEAVPAVSRLLRCAMPVARIAARRRQNYVKLLEGLSGLPGVLPVFNHLPDGVVPYMFPLVVEGLDRLFAELEDLALPMQRFGQFPFDDTDGPPCAVSAKMARSGLQLACHQELRDVEIDWIIGTFRQVVQGRS
jgi:dTDP-4-amino-4,6-dideoxygalactose transaminase